MTCVLPVFQWGSWVRVQFSASCLGWRAGGRIATESESSCQNASTVMTYRRMTTGADDVAMPLCYHATIFVLHRMTFHAITSRSANSFTKWSSKVIHTPLALNPCSLGVRVITVPSTSIFAARLSEADVHHTASFNSIRRPVHTSCSFHARAMHQSSAGDIATSQQLSAKSSNPMYLPSTGNLHFSAWHLLQNAVAGTSRAAPNTFAAHGSPCGTERVRRIPGVNMSSSLMRVSELLYTLIHAATNTGGTFRASMASMIR